MTPGSVNINYNKILTPLFKMASTLRPAHQIAWRVNHPLKLDLKQLSQMLILLLPVLTGSHPLLAWPFHSWEDGYAGRIDCVTLDLFRSMLSEVRGHVLKCSALKPRKKAYSGAPYGQGRFTAGGGQQEPTPCLCSKVWTDLKSQWRIMFRVYYIQKPFWVRGTVHEEKRRNKTTNKSSLQMALQTILQCPLRIISRKESKVEQL